MSKFSELREQLGCVDLPPIEPEIPIVEEEEKKAFTTIAGEALHAAAAAMVKSLKSNGIDVTERDVLVGILFKVADDVAHLVPVEESNRQLVSSMKILQEVLRVESGMSPLNVDHHVDENGDQYLAVRFSNGDPDRSREIVFSQKGPNDRTWTIH